MSELINKIRQPTVPLEAQDVSSEKMTEAMKRITVMGSIDELRTLRDAIDQRMTAKIQQTVRDQLGYLKLMVGDRISAKDPLYARSAGEAIQALPKAVDSGARSFYRGMADTSTGMPVARTLGVGAMLTGLFVWLRGAMRLRRGKQVPPEEPVLEVLPVEEKPKTKKAKKTKKKEPDVKREDLITDRD